MSIIKQLGKIPKEYSKTKIEELAKEDIQQVLLEEKYDIQKVFIELKRYEIYLNELINQLKQPVTNKITQNPYSDDYVKLSIIKRVSYDYEENPSWHVMNQRLLSAKNQLKEHQEALRQLKEGESKHFVDEETGEMFLMKAPQKKESESVMMKIKNDSVVEH